MNDELRLQCCFCRLTVAERPPDPCELIVVSGFGKPEAERRAQTVYCHAECLRKSADPAMPWDALDADG